MKKVFIAALAAVIAFPSLAFAQDPQSVTLPDGSIQYTVYSSENAGWFNSGMLQSITYHCKNGVCDPINKQNVASDSKVDSLGRPVINAVGDIGASALGSLLFRPAPSQTNVSGGTVSNSNSTSSSGGNATGQGGNSTAQGGTGLGGSAAGGRADSNSAGYGGNSNSDANGYGGYSNAQQNSGNNTNSNNTIRSFNKDNSDNVVQTTNISGHVGPIIIPPPPVPVIPPCCGKG